MKFGIFSFFEDIFSLGFFVLKTYLVYGKNVEYIFSLRLFLNTYLVCGFFSEDIFSPRFFFKDIFSLRQKNGKTYLVYGKEFEYIFSQSVELLSQPGKLLASFWKLQNKLLGSFCSLWKAVGSF